MTDCTILAVEVMHSLIKYPRKMHYAILLKIVELEIDS